MVYPLIGSDSHGWITASEMVEVDRFMIDEFGIDLARMLQSAVRNLARVAIELFGGAPDFRQGTILELADA